MPVEVTEGAVHVSTAGELAKSRDCPSKVSVMRLSRTSSVAVTVKVTTSPAVYVESARDGATVIAVITGFC